MPIQYPFAADPADPAVHPGWRFIEALRSAEAVATSLEITTPPTRQWASGLANQYATTLSPMPPGGFIDFLEWDILRSIATPLLRLRGEEGDRAFIDPERYVALLSRMPVPPFVFTDRGMMRTGAVTPMFSRSWVTWAMLDQLMFDMTFNEVAYCPRHPRGKLSRYLGAVSLQEEPNCADALRDGCGWFGFDGDLDHLPGCQFRKSVRGFKLDELTLQVQEEPAAALEAPQIGQVTHNVAVNRSALDATGRTVPRRLRTRGAR
jgi:hypothetical protein